jgi:hypothetical protein
MDVLNLPLLGWLFAVGSGLALGLGLWIVVALRYGGEGARKQLAARVAEDVVLFALWTLGLAGGIGVLQEKAWSRWVLELFCWALIILSVLSGISRWRASPPPRGLLLVSLLLFIFPLIVFCLATVATLRSEIAQRVLAG